MKITQALIVAFGCTFPALAQAETPAQKYVVSIDVIDSGTKVFAPRIVMAAGAVARLSVSEDIPAARANELEKKAPKYQIGVSLPQLASMETGPFPIHVVLERFVDRSWVELADRDVSVRLGEATTLQAPAPPGAASGRSLTLKIDVARFEKGAGTAATSRPERAPVP